MDVKCEGCTDSGDKAEAFYCHCVVFVCEFLEDEVLQEDEIAHESII